MKLSHRLITVCKRLQLSASVPVELHFFPGETGWRTDGCRALINSHLEDACVWPYMSYEDFIDKLSICDLALAAFPFGNTNSTVDAALLGLPVVANFGVETPAQTDKMVLRAAGYPDWLVCQGDEAYFETALALVEDLNLRNSLSGNLNLRQVREQVASAGAPSEQPELGDMLFWVLKNQTKLRQSKNKIFHWTDCCG